MGFLNIKLSASSFKEALFSKCNPVAALITQLAVSFFCFVYVPLY